MLRLAPLLVLLLGACVFDGTGQAGVRQPDAGAPEDPPPPDAGPPQPDAGAPQPDRPDAAPPDGNDDDEDGEGNGGGLLRGGEICNDDDECESGECDRAGGGIEQCLAACRVDADCPAGLECDDGACDD